MEDRQNCPNCGQPRDPETSFCPNCGKPFDSSASDLNYPSDQAEQPSSLSSEEKTSEFYVAWEDKRKIGFFNALWTTWKESVFYPNKFFSHLPSEGGLGAPLLYAVIVGWLGYAASQIFSLLFSGFWYGLMSGFMPERELILGAGSQTILALIYIILAPVFVIVGIFISSGIYHLLFMILGWAKRDFEATFRALCYASGPMAFALVPFCGGIVGWIWEIVLIVIGFKHMQKTTAGKAAFVFFIPAIVCFCLIMLLVLFFSAAILGFIQQSTGNGYVF